MSIEVGQIYIHISSGEPRQIVLYPSVINGEYIYFTRINSTSPDLSYLHVGELKFLKTHRLINKFFKKLYGIL